MSVLRFVAFIDITLAGGLLLARFIASFPYEMPLWLYSTLRFLLDRTGNEDIRDPADLEVLGLLALLVGCCVATGIALWLMLAVARRSVGRRRQG